MKKLPLALTVGMGVFFSASIHARDWHVRADASAPGDGSGDKPFPTLTAAVPGLAPGDRVVIAPGIYRENVVVSASGTRETPITIESQDAANPAIFSGADALTGWQPLAGSQLKEAGHLHAAEIYYTDIDWAPTSLFAGAAKQLIAREPNSGWFSATTSDGKTISSDGLAGVKAESLADAQIFFFRAKGVEQQFADVQDWSNGTKGTSLDLIEPLFKGRAVPYTEGDRFYLQNHTSFIDRPGEWVSQKTDAGTRLFWWPPSKDSLALAESPRREQVIDLSGANYVTVKNLAIRHAAPSASGFGIGFQNTGATTGARNGVTIESCTVYQNQRFGVVLNGCNDTTLKNSLITDNSYGVTISKSRNVLVQNNEIAWNLNDGLIIAWDTEDAIVKGNVIHHHSRFAHPDNFQTYRGVKNVLLDSNVLVASGQGAHTQQTVDLTARNNIFAGASANVFFTSGPDNKNTGTEKEGGGYVLENNTFTLFANGAVLIKGPGHKMSGNVFDVRGGTYAYGADVPSAAVESKNNRFAMAHSSHNLLASFKDAKSERFSDLKDLQEKTGLEEGSVFGDPQFPSAPVLVASLDGKRISECTESRLVYDGENAFKPGDHVEFDFDGVDRVVRDADATSIVIDPPLPGAPLTTVLLSNWGSKPVGKINLATNDRRGSTVNFEAYMRGDFDNDGKRNVPAWPEGIASPRKNPQ